MLNGLDLFSGIGGISYALRGYVQPIAYCEIDPYCQGVLLSRMGKNEIPEAPIWDNVCTLSGEGFRGNIDLVYGGFPCQDISVAGHGKGLEGERSGLFFEIVRLAKEIQSPFLFLENVPAITSRGGLRVVREITEMGYDCRWCVISAASVGALHRRERWFLLAHRIGDRGRANASGHELSPQSTELQRPDGEARSNNAEAVCGYAPNAPSMRRDEGSGEGIHPERESSIYEELSDLCGASNVGWIIADADGKRIASGESDEQRRPISSDTQCNSPIFVDWENTEPPVCGVAHGVPHRVDRIRALGNAVVPKQAREAFEVLMGLK